MKKFLVTAISVLLISFPAVSELLTGTVIDVHDGDTLTLKSGDKERKIRLAGIDVPELSQPYGVESRNALREVVLNRDLKVGTFKTDRYGRSVGKVSFDGQDINLKQVNAGMAWVYTDYLRELSNADRGVYLDAEAKSKSEDTGLWKMNEPIEPWIWRNLKVLN
jgi:endonuclease YncB( thermonuclease family)